MNEAQIKLWISTLDHVIWNRSVYIDHVYTLLLEGVFDKKQYLPFVNFLVIKKAVMFYRYKLCK